MGVEVFTQQICFVFSSMGIEVSGQQVSSLLLSIIKFLLVQQSHYATKAYLVLIYAQTSTYTYLQELICWVCVKNKKLDVNVATNIHHYILF